MNFRCWIEMAVRHRTAMVLVALVTTFAGVALIVDRPKGTVLEWLALPLLVAGGALFAWAVWPRGAEAAAKPNSMASRLLGRITFGGRLVQLFPAIGVAIVLADIGYNLVLSATPAIQTEDTIVLLAAAALLGYRLVPSRFARERDFVLLFFLCLNAILVVPLLLARVFYADFERSVDVYSWVALAPETGAILQFLGVSNTVHAVGGSSAPGLSFMLLHSPTQVTVVITTACSGIYSFGIFASAFITFVLTEYETLSRRVWLLLTSGLVTAYMANVLRMVVIVLVGYYTDSEQTDLQNMLVAHSYAGWIIFLGWIALFWSVLLKLLPVSPSRLTNLLPARASSRSVARCSLCQGPLTPFVPAVKCSCGSMYHRVCLDSAIRCSACGRRPSTLLAAKSDQS